MVDSELLRHQEMWKSFTSFAKYGIIGVAVLLAILAATLVH